MPTWFTERQVRKFLKKHLPGAEFETTGGGHYRIKHPDLAKVIFAPKTPSDPDYQKLLARKIRANLRESAR